MLIVICPHCNEPIVIEQINCAIFRHAVFKSNMEPIPPHSTREECEKLLKDDLVWGCGKPFKIEDNKAIICDYL